MISQPDADSFEHLIEAIIADVESDATVTESDMLQLEPVVALSRLLWVSHQVTSKAQEGRTSVPVELMMSYRAGRSLARTALGVLAGCDKHELLNLQKARNLLVLNARNADMVVRMMRDAMSNSKSGGDG